MGYGFDFDNNGKVDDLEEFLTFEMTRRAAKNSGCVTAILTALLVPVVLAVIVL